LKKKVLTILSLLFVMCFVVLFRFIDSGGIVTAKQGSEDSVNDIPLRANMLAGKVIDNESAFLITPQEEEGTSKVVYETSDEAVEATTSVATETKGVSTPESESIILFGEEYVKVIDEKFASYIKIANEWNAAFYAIPNSDCFAIVKDGEVLFQMSTGIKGVPVQYVDLLVQIFADNVETNTVGPIQDDIRKLASTGETISVEGKDFSGYSIFIQDGWIIVSF